MNPISGEIEFDLKCLFLTLLFNVGLCLLLAYQVSTMSVASPEQLYELQSILEEDLDKEERKSILATLFEVVSKREQTRKSLRDLVLRFSLGMLPLLLASLLLVFRVLRKTKSARDFEGLTPD